MPEFADPYRDSRSYCDTVEQRFPVNDWAIGGIHVWPMVRMPLQYNLQNTADASARRACWLLLLKSVPFLSYLRCRLLDRRGYVPRPRRADVLFLTHAGNRARLPGGEAVDRFVDPIQDLLDERGISSFVMERMRPGVERFFPRQRSAHQFWWPSVRTRLENSLLPRRLPVAMQGYEEARTAVARETDCALPAADALARRVAALADLRRYFAAILREVSPRAAFGVCFYGLENMALSAACREACLPSVDIQHGYAGAMHHAYSNWSTFPRNGYEVMPSYFWRWDDRSAQEIAPWLEPMAPYHRSVVGGNPANMLHRFVDETSVDVQAFKRLSNGRGEGGRVNVLVALTVIEDCGDGSYSQIPGFLHGLVKAMGETCFWWIRLHPNTSSTESRQVRADLAAMRYANMEAEMASRLPLSFIMSHMDLLVTEGSSIVYEAEAMGIPSLITSRKAPAAFESVIRSGRASVAEGPREIGDRIRALAGLQSSANDPRDLADRTHRQMAWALDVILSGSTSETQPSAEWREPVLAERGCA